MSTEKIMFIKNKKVCWFQ